MTPVRRTDDGGHALHGDRGVGQRCEQIRSLGDCACEYVGRRRRVRKRSITILAAVTD
jgi:hypothetical protein